MTSKILIVDDTPSVRELIASYLRKGGHEVIEAKDGEDALVKAFNNSPDIIITDVVMPQMNGFELCRSLKKNPNMKDLKVIICTSKNQEIDRMWGMRQGADAYLTKPFTEKEIIKVVSSIVA